MEENVNKDERKGSVKDMSSKHLSRNALSNLTKQKLRENKLSPSRDNNENTRTWIHIKINKKKRRKKL